MAISDKLTYLNTTKSNIKTMINYGLTTPITNETFRSYATKIYLAFIESLNNPSTLFNNLPKKSGSGTTISLNDTIEAPMKIDLGASALQQATTTGKNLLAYSLQTIKAKNSSGTWNNNVYTWNGITFTINDDLSITIGGTYSQRAYMYLTDYFSITPNVYILNGSPTNGKLTLDIKNNGIWTSAKDDNGNGVECDLTSYQNPSIDVYIDINSSNKIGETYYPMLRLSTISDGSYEPYTNGASPNPSYPQTIHTISGNNTINISDGTNTTSYPINLGTLEYCKIGNYTDEIFKSSGKNLFDNYNYTIKSSTATWTPTSTGGIYSNTGTWGDGITWQFYVDTSKKYTIVAKGFANQVWFYVRTTTDSTYSTLKTHYVNDGTGNITKTFQPDSPYLVVKIANSSAVSNFTISDIQLELGETATTYEPYGTDWYIKKNIGKVDLSTLTWTPTYNIGDGYKLYGTTIDNLKYASVNTQVVPAFAEKYIERQGSGLSSPSYRYYCAIDVSKFVVHLEDNITPTGLFYYPLSTPTYTKIPNQEQLDVIYKSYTGTTNITQTNNDLPFVMSVQAIEDLQ